MIVIDGAHDVLDAAVRVAHIVVDPEFDALAVEAAVAVDPIPPQLCGLEHVAAPDGVVRLRQRHDHADAGRGRGGACRGRAQEHPTAERRRGQCRDERFAPRQLFVHSIL